MSGTSGLGDVRVRVTCSTTTGQFDLSGDLQKLTVGSPVRTLTVSLAGSGQGSVASTPAGIDCGADCTEPYTDGTVVTLTPTPAARSWFGGWAGACTGSGACQITISADAAVTATFGPAGEVLPSSVTMEVGTLLSGNAASLSADDDNYLVVRSTKPGTKTATWYGTFTGVDNATTSLEITYRGKSSVTCTQVVLIWRWTDSTWVQLDSRSVGTSEVEVADLEPVGTLADLVSGTTGTGDVQVRVTCSTTTSQFQLSGELLKLREDLAAPVVQLIEPTGGATLFATESLAATASDDTGIDRVEFLVDNAVVGTATAPPYEITWDTTASDGPHTVVARAFDHADNQTDSLPANVIVDNALAGPERVLADADAGTLTPDERALYGAWSIGNPSLLPVRYQSSEAVDAEPTTLLAQFYENWDELSATTRQQIDDFFAAPSVSGPSACDYTMPFLWGSVILTCLRVIDSFEIFYNPISDPIHGVSEEYIDTLATELQAAWGTYADMGFTVPSPPVRVAVLSSPTGRSWVQPAGQAWTIFMHRGDTPTYTARHELFHRFAMEYWGNSGLTREVESNVWWHELTADWAAHIAGEGAEGADLYAAKLSKFLGDTTPDLWNGLTIFGPSGRDYGSFIFAEYLEERYPRPVDDSIIKEIYETIRDEIPAPGNISASEAISMVVDAAESSDTPDVDVRRMMQGFVATTYTLGYDDPDSGVWRAALGPDSTGGDAQSPLVSRE